MMIRTEYKLTIIEEGDTTMINVDSLGPNQRMIFNGTVKSPIMRRDLERLAIESLRNYVTGDKPRGSNG